MSFSKVINSEPFVANSDLSAAKFRIVELHSTVGKVEIAAANQGYGVLQNEPKSGEHAAVATIGQTRCQAGAAITLGDRVTAANSGFATAVLSGAASPKRLIGRAITTAASGMFFVLELGRETYFPASGAAL